MMSSRESTKELQGLEEIEEFSCLKIGRRKEVLEIWTRPTIGHMESKVRGSSQGIKQNFNNKNKFKARVEHTENNH